MREWFQDLRDEWTAPGYAHGKMAGLALMGCVIMAVGAGVATGAWIFGVGEVAAGTVGKLWLYTAGFGVVAGVFLVLARREIDAAEHAGRR